MRPVSIILWIGQRMMADLRNAIDGVDNVLDAGDEGLRFHRICPADLGVDLVLTGLQLIDARVIAAALEGGTGGLQQGQDGAFILPHDLSAFDEVDALLDCITRRNDTQNQGGGTSVPAIRDSNGQRMATETERIGHHRRGPQHIGAITPNEMQRIILVIGGTGGVENDRRVTAVDRDGV